MAQPMFHPVTVRRIGPKQSSALSGRWYRHGDQIVIDFGPDIAVELSEEELGEVAGDGAVIQRAIQQGSRDENQLTDMIFNARHPDRHGRRLQPSEQLLVQEWLKIRDSLVQPALRNTLLPRGGAAQQVQIAAQLASTTSGVEAAGNATGIIHCLQGETDQGRAITFVQRYLRDLTRAEAIAVSNAGFKIVSCFEENAADPPITRFTRAQGQHDGRRAFTQAQALGQPADTPIYFAIDTDPNNSQRHFVEEYLEGVRDGFNQYLADMQAQHKSAVNYEIGVYGSGCVLDWCQAQGIATWFWQAFAPGWCGNQQVWPGTNIRTSGRDTPQRCGWSLGHLEGWGNEGGWALTAPVQPELSFADKRSLWS
jgi:hypothetical protein